jgi:hypothetical protein
MLAERYGWGAEWVIAPALITLAGALVWTGEFDEGERWLQRARQARQADSGPDIGLLLHHSIGMLRACRGRHHEALPEFTAADQLQSQLAGSHALASQVTGWLLATQARLGTSSTCCAAHHPRPVTQARHRQPSSSARANCECCAICRPTCPGRRSPANCPCR